MHIDMKVALFSGVLGFVFGALSTLVFEPFANRQGIGQEAIFDHLTAEYERRLQRFVAIRRSGTSALQDPTSEQIAAAIWEATDLPFFRPRDGENAFANEPISDASRSFTQALRVYEQSGDERFLESARFHFEAMTCWFDLSLRSIEMQMFDVDQDAQAKFVSANWDPELLGQSC